jgi:hypothetical protein
VKKALIRLTILLVVFGFLSSLPGQTRQPMPDKGRLKKSITFLASDSLKGRESGTAEGDVAAYFIAKAFREAGLKPAFTARQSTFDEDSTASEGFEQSDSLALFFQRFSFVASRLSNKQELKIVQTLPQGTSIASYNTPSDFYIQYSGQVGVTVTAPVAFCGFGIDVGPDGYNDYRGPSGNEVNVAGKVVLVMDGFPRQDDSTSAFRKKRSPFYINALRKADAAKAKGAVALIVVEPRLDGVQSFEQRYERSKRSLQSAKYELPSRATSTIPIFFVSRKIARDVLGDAGASLDSLFRSIEMSLKPAAFDVPKRLITFDVSFDVQRVKTQNVVGILPGTDSVLGKECVVIGGHYDHVGLGSHGSMSRKFAGMVHHGADDNASGTASVMELARLLAGTGLKRTVVFVAFAAEEFGLLGSQFYLADQPILPLRNTIAMLNLDMVGRNEDSLLWAGGAFYSNDMKAIAEEANKEIGFNLLYNTGLLTFASDQAGFIRRRIPALFFFAGLHEDYHSPADVVDRINFEKMARVVSLAANAARILADGPIKPKYEEMPMSDRAKLVQESSKVMRRFRPSPEKK